MPLPLLAAPLIGGFGVGTAGAAGAGSLGGALGSALLTGGAAFAGFDLAGRAVGALSGESDEEKINERLLSHAATEAGRRDFEDRLENNLVESLLAIEDAAPTSLGAVETQREVDLMKLLQSERASLSAMSARTPPSAAEIMALTGRRIL